MAKRKDDYIQKMKPNLKVVIDLQFYNLMTEKEQYSLVKQLSYCHSVNRKAQKPFNYILTSAEGQGRKDLETKYNAHQWGVTLNEENLLDCFPK